MPAGNGDNHDLTISNGRIQALLKGKPVDRVPFFPLHVMGFAAVNVGYPLGSMYSDAEMSFRAQVWTQEQYGYEYMPIYNYASYGAWEFGGEIKLPSREWDQAPSVVRYPVSSEEDVDRLERSGLPDIKTRGSVPLNMAFSRLQEEHGLPIVFLCGTPFTRAANVCGSENLLRWIIKKPELSHRVLRLMTDHLVEVAQYWVDTFGGERLIPYSGNPMETNQMLSPKRFEAFALPYTRELHERVLAMGVKHFQFHACGDQNLNLPYLAQIPLGDPGIISFGHEVDLTRAIEYFGESSIIVGNVEPAVIQTGTPREVYELARKCVEKGKEAPRGFMLSQSCELPPKAPPYNVYMMKKAIDAFGLY
ncbi:MAG: uroporphyrinogen decarboxylase family protein [Deltaproteobacteria bacterium]|nr:uroporphyrinogen decarboxylase family protein [Deltaproteobacteria bacterium]